MNILINTPSIKEARGGVANHYKGLQKFWSEDVEYNIIGNRNKVPGFLVLPFDMFKFIWKCVIKRPDIIVLNPSLGRTAFRRDALYLLISKALRLKTIIFIHGWDEKQEQLISKASPLFLQLLNKADAYLVLASSFKEKLKSWGITSQILLTTTKVDNDLVHDFHIGEKDYLPRILFLARIEKEKGIFTAIDSFQIIQKQIPEVKMIIAGEGNSLVKAKNTVKQKNLHNIEFLGKISGKELRQAFKQSSLYFLPTSHGEGLPTSILEAMAFGLPVITRPVGGIIDFFNNGKMGYLIKSLDFNDFAEKISEILKNSNKMKDMSTYNYTYAKENFMASKVAADLENIFSRIHQIKN